MTVDDNDPRIERCAFAKLQSVDGTFEYFIRKYEIVLGRNSKSAHADVVLGMCGTWHHKHHREHGTHPHTHTQHSGENSNISRKHAVISYNFAKGMGFHAAHTPSALHIPPPQHTNAQEPLSLLYSPRTA